MRGLFITAALAATTILSVPVSAKQNTGKTLSTTLEGEQVTFGGDLDGTGTARIRINVGRGEICYTLTVRRIETATLAHIHEGLEGENGPVVVDFVPPASGSSSGCLFVGRELAMEITRTPSDYYVVVHNDEFPAGALRGQLGR